MISLHNIGVLNEYQGKGIGSQLMNEFKKEGLELRGCVNEKNSSPRELYKKLGFKEVITEYGLVWKE